MQETRNIVDNEYFRDAPCIPHHDRIECWQGLLERMFFEYAKL
ncbi:MAG: hypothetical protein HW384_1458 [Dehalococcoidia bacterium]|nr:hypothetical protein [Dehalococcoidia bacterium]